ncbi:ArsR/SmtB family transcription factor [Prosthecomicrobium pneumaticum]|uniref:DNA-binding transcriptional ArsR family regulator n=1 Tax=Prosthecomicrobium pneumaticum TaxID=81895 RepID=A0A7W9CUU6_9HYPH|nr:metalloregulator ArsR/SmtB family transcription factor [Prosthecomicrobium pneumaticum]MBB5752064.1 DNA-binding transcriptional ArsR family regulator [Prosthecomicrobium pneumaticum]
MSGAPRIATHDLAALEARAGEAAALLALMANEKRLLLLCHLCGVGEAPVGALAEAVGLSQSAASQHLARLREEGVVAFRRDGQTLHYRVGHAGALRLLATLKDLFCPADLPAGAPKGTTP